MQIMLFLILVSLVLAVGFLIAYLRAVRAGQFDDEYTPAVRMLFDPTPNPSQAEKGIDPADKSTENE
jgi:cbb3-type cytochrome oxidase maturation protein